MSASVAAAKQFVYTNARLLERRTWEALFDGAPVDGVVAAVRAYVNADGGLGNALEPDKRAPDSQPLDVAFALERLHDVGARDEDLARGALEFLESVADERGLVPIVLPSVASYARADHWEDGDFPATLAPALGIAAVLHAWGLQHPWLERVTSTCLDELGRNPPDDAHALREALLFLEYAPDRERAEAVAGSVVDALRSARWMRRDPESTDYGLTPLEFAPTPASRWRAVFADEEIDAHLDRLERDQQDDGGWPLTWEPPGDAARLEWRGFETIRAVRALRAYGRSAG
jgi:hypothetical protein